MGCMHTPGTSDLYLLKNKYVPRADLTRQEGHTDGDNVT